MKTIIFPLVWLIFSINLATCQPNPECMKRPPIDKDPSECCKGPSLIDEAIFKKCQTDFGGKENLPPPPPPGAPPLPSMPPRGCCVSECVFNATGIFLNGNIDKAAATKLLTTAVSNDTVWAPIVTAGLESCTAQLITKEAEFKAVANLPPSPTGERICNPVSGFLMGCMHSHLFRNCPVSKWTDNTDCVELKKHLDKCPMPFPMKIHD